MAFNSANRAEETLMNSDTHVAPEMLVVGSACGALVRALENWCPRFAGSFLYYPSGRQQPAALSALSALIDMLRLTDRRK